jgi:hypothetical protein
MAAALKLRKPLHPTGDRNRYCGPSAISILTGMGTGEAARLLRAVSRRTAIKGASTASVIRALDRCGVRYSRAQVEPKQTLAGWLKLTHGQRGGRFFLIVAGNHFQVVSGNRYACGRTNDVVELDHPSVKRRARVDVVWELRAPNGVTIPQEARKPPPDTFTRAKASARSTAQKLALAWDLRVEPEREGRGYVWWVYGPDGIYAEDGEDDPCQGSHFCTDWIEVKDCIDAYVADLTVRGITPRGATE